MRRYEYLTGKEILILGGTGTLGKALCEVLITRKVRGIRIFSRGELKQSQMFLEFKNSPVPVSFLIGDVRDYSRLRLAMNRVDIVINAAAMKHIDICEKNPLEAINTNVKGAENIIRAALDTKVEKVLHISTDKAVYPINLYGATKAVAEKLMIQANVYGVFQKPIFNCCRYGNVVGSRGSVVNKFKEQYKKYGKVFITDPRMTRFWLPLEDAVSLVLAALEDDKGGKIFTPGEMISSYIDDFAKAILDKEDIFFEITGERPGEKLNECMMAEEESLYKKVWLCRSSNRAYNVIYSPMFHRKVSVNFTGAWTSKEGLVLDYKDLREKLKLG